MQPYENLSNVDIECEQWDNVVGYEGLYMVSNMGRIKSVKFGKENMLRQSFNTWGYLMVGICRNGISVTKSVHRLVAAHFLPNPENKPQINHKNGVKTDNKVTEIEWVTNKENSAHAWSTGLIRVTEAQVIKMRNAKKGKTHLGKLVLNLQTGVYYDSVKDAAFSLGLKRTTLGNMLVGRNKNRTSFIYV